MKKWSQHQQNCLQAMGVVLWQQKVDVDAVDVHKQGFEQPVQPTINKNISLGELKLAITDCSNCASNKGEIGFGNIRSNIVILLDAKNMLTGDTGELLNKMLQAISLKQENIYSSFLNKCQLHLQQELSIINPKLVLVFSDKASVISNFQTLSTYSLNTIIHDSLKKRAVWEILKKAKSIIDENGLS